MNYSRAKLIEEMSKGKRPEFFFFWGHQPQKDGSMGKGCFSQWYPAPFKVKTSRYLTAEHWMMAEKARLFGDKTILKKILEAGSPGLAKKLGRMVGGFDQAVWEEKRMEIVVKGNVKKFEQNPDMKAFLLSTGDQILVEASPPDKIWGIGMAEKNERAVSPRLWHGENLLGFALMEVRDLLAE